MGDEPLSGVGATALRVAAVRARESARPDRLFDDPYAAAFAAQRTGGPDARQRTGGPDTRQPTDGPDAAQRTGGPEVGRRESDALRAALARHVVIRTRFYDDYLLAAGHRQVVLLAAGLDARAFRLDWPPGTRLFEVDLPEVLAVKHRVLAERGARPACERVPVVADLREDFSAPLRAAGFEPAEPTAWLVEGLLVYLDAESATRLLTGVDALSAAGSTLACERGNADRVAGAGTGTVPGVTALWRGGLGEDPAAWFTRRGWRTETRELDDLAASYGRPATDPVRSGFVTATAHRAEPPSPGRALR